VKLCKCPTSTPVLVGLEVRHTKSKSNKAQEAITLYSNPAPLSAPDEFVEDEGASAAVTPCLRMDDKALWLQLLCRLLFLGSLHRYEVLLLSPL
jgi:hypothetical protein